MAPISPILVVAAFLCTGCSPHVIHPKPIEKNETIFPPITDSSSPLIGVALSGGGSRAAYFSASGLEAIAAVQSQEHSLLEQITHLSSVSGGSVAASYFAMFKPNHAVPILQNGGMSEEYQKFFAEYQQVMGTNFKRGIVWRQFFKGRWFSSPKRAASLAEVLDRTYLDQKTLAHLYAREQSGDIPRLILNATLYNDGRRVAMTTLPSADFNYDVIALLQEELVKDSPSPRKLPESLRRAQQSLIPNTFEDFAIDARHVPLSYAVAASASFPFLIGPISVERATPKTFLHVGDGGLFDNQGTESLVQLFLKQLNGKENENRRALVIAFDSSFPFWIKNTQFDELRNGFKIFLDDPGRIVGIMEQRANAYQAMVWHILQTNEILLPNEQRIKVVVIRHTDENIWPKDPAGIQHILPNTCRNIGKPFASREELRQHLAMIPTQFKLASACDKDLLALAAKRGVESKKAEIIKFLAAK